MSKKAQRTSGKGRVRRRDVKLLFEVTRQRFIDDAPNAIVMALEGMKWLLGRHSAVTRASLKDEHGE